MLFHILHFHSLIPTVLCWLYETMKQQQVLFTQDIRYGNPHISSMKNDDLMTISFDNKLSVSIFFNISSNIYSLSKEKRLVHLFCAFHSNFIDIYFKYE